MKHGRGARASRRRIVDVDEDCRRLGASLEAAAGTISSWIDRGVGGGMRILCVCQSFSSEGGKGLRGGEGLADIDGSGGGGSGGGVGAWGGGEE